MSPGTGNCNKISHIVKIRQMLRRWRRKSALSSPSSVHGITQRRVPSDVPAGHVAIRVGTSSKRFVVPATYLNHPIFKRLLVQAEEEYGFVNQGPLTIPCDESLFEEILEFVSRAESSDSTRSINFEDFQRCSLEGYLKINQAESRPLLGGQSIF